MLARKIKRLICLSAILCSQIYGDKAQDEATIRSNSKALVESYNRRNAEQLSSLWSKEATLTNTAGITLQGRDEIASYYKKKFSESTHSTLEIFVKTIDFKTPELAIERGLLRLTHADHSIEQSAFKAYYVKENDRWLLHDIGEIELRAAPSHYEQLKEINWLVGNWEDTDEDVSILSSYKWDKYKNFLTQQFYVKIHDQDELEGQQIIGWDSIKKRIRSWVFDSDGGFGRGVWTKDKDSWLVQSVYITPDGRKGSATNIYTKVDENSYTFSSVGRELDGEILPDIAPVKVIRRP